MADKGRCCNIGTAYSRLTAGPYTTDPPIVAGNSTAAPRLPHEMLKAFSTGAGEKMSGTSELQVTLSGLSVTSSEDAGPSPTSRSPRQDFLRRSASGMVRVINPLRASVGLGRKQLNPMNDIVGDDDSDSPSCSPAPRWRSTAEADPTARRSRGCPSDDLPFIRLVRSRQPMHHAQADLVRRADAGEFDSTERTSQSGGPPLAAIQRDVFEADLASYNEWHYSRRNVKASSNDWTMAAALGCTSSQCSEQCRQLRRAAGVLKPKTISLLEREAGFGFDAGFDFEAWYEVPTTDVTQHIQAIRPCRSVALMDAMRPIHDGNTQRDQTHDAARAGELECLKAINATPPWLRAVVRAEQHLAFAKMALNNQPQDQLQLPYDVILTVGNLLTARRGTTASDLSASDLSASDLLQSLLTTHTVAWRSERWVELCGERQDAEDEILSLAPAISTAVTRVQKARKREQDVEEIGECCAMSALSLAGMLLAGVLVMVGLWNYAWGYYKISEHEEVCECQMQAVPAPESDLGNGTSALVEDCCSAEVMSACLEMRRSAQRLFWCVTVFTLLKAFTQAMSHLRSAAYDEDDGVAERRAEAWNRRWRCVGCVQVYAVISLWISMFSDDTDECTEELIDGTRIIVFGPICVSLVFCTSIICIAVCAAVCEERTE